MSTTALNSVVDRAWHAFGALAAEPWLVTPSMPVLYFGDRIAYEQSDLRVLTVGLNPSLREFPADPFERFPGGTPDREKGFTPAAYLESLDAYFRAAPYRQWFGSFEAILEGMECSYYEGQPSTALHTDICSPFATDPTWAKLSDGAKWQLLETGPALWHDLARALEPRVIIISVAKDHVARIVETPVDDWKVLHTLHGEKRKEPHRTRSITWDASWGPVLVVFGRAVNTPFGNVSKADRRAIGRSIVGAARG